MRRFLEATLDLLFDTLQKLGLSPGGATWWRARWRRRMERLSDETETVRRAVQTKHRMCRECRALVPTRERFCTSCGAPMIGIPKGGASRLVGYFLPSFGSVAISILTAIIGIYALSILAWPPGALLSPSGTALSALGIKFFPPFLHGEWWRLVNPIFLHGGLMHLLFNSYAFATLGPLLEGICGGRKLLVLFIGTGVASFIASMAIAPFTPSIGASGAILGLIGYAIVRGSIDRRSMLAAYREPFVSWGIISLVWGLVFPGIDNAAHFGGFAAGAFAALLIGERERRRPWVDRLWTLGAIVAVLLPTFGFALALIQLMQASTP